MRDPGVYITHKQLELVLSALNLREFTDQVFQVLCSTSPVNRLHIEIRNTKNNSKLVQQLEVNTALVDKFCIALNNVLAANKITIYKISINESAYKTLIKVSEMAYEFYKAYSETFVDAHAAYTTYVTLGIHTMGGPIKYALNKFSYNNEKIHKLYANHISAEQIQVDPGIVEKIIMGYCKRTGLSEEHIDMYTDFIHFKLAAIDIVNKVKSSEYPVRTWMDAQFAELAWTGSNPSPSQLHGNSAYKRYLDYNKKANK